MYFSARRYAWTASSSPGSGWTNWMKTKPFSAATSMPALTPLTIDGGVCHAPTRLLAFFGLARPSLSRSQFTPSARVPGWQLVQLSHCWKQCSPSWNRNSPRLTTVILRGAAVAIVLRTAPVVPSSTATLSEK